MEKYFQIEGKVNKFIKYQVYFERKGYFLYFSLVTRNEIDGITFEQKGVVFHEKHVNVFLFECKRASKKSFKKSIEIAETIKTELTEKFIQSLNL
jgi:hypothetical protein